MSSARRSWFAIWGPPILLAVLTAAGLLSALLGQRGPWLPISWALLAIPLVVIVASVCRGQVAPGRPSRRRGQRAVTTTGVPTETR